MTAPAVIHHADNTNILGYAKPMAHQELVFYNTLHVISGIRNLCIN
ncbi:MAG: hypothetical protein UHT92_08990 [Prevotella sp.]|nr:hypothetical protein [Prevotella sp.]